MQELAEHPLGPTGSLLQQLKVTIFTTSNSRFPCFLWLCKSGMWLTCIRHPSDQIPDGSEVMVWKDTCSQSCRQGAQGGLTQNRASVNLFSLLLPQMCFPPSEDIVSLVLMQYFVSYCAVRVVFKFFPYQSVFSELLVASIFAEQVQASQFLPLLEQVSQAVPEQAAGQ